MSKYAYIFVERNMGNDYAYAEPPLDLIRWWLWPHCIYPEAKSALETRVQMLKSESPKNFKETLADGISTYTYSHHHTVYSVKIMPDTLCPDPRAVGRCPYFIMHLLMPGTPEVISKRFNEFRSYCQGIAWHTMHAGTRTNLKVEIPNNLYL